MQDAYEPFFEDLRAESAFIHESSYVDTPCRIGENTVVMHFAHIAANSIIGNDCHIGRNVTIASGVFLGDNVKVMNHAQLNTGVIMENDVYCGAHAVFVEPRRVRADNPNISRISPTLVRAGAQIGPHTTVSSGFTIGRYSFIEAGTVVDSNIPDFAIVYGNPLKFAGWRCECGSTLLKEGKARQSTKSDQHPEGVQCSYCNRQYLRQSRWKLVQSTLGAHALDSHSEPDPSIRTAQGPD